LNSVASLKKFISQEEQSNTAYLIAKLESEPICVEGYDECGVCGGNGLTCAPRGCDGVRGRFVFLFFICYYEINFESFIFLVEKFMINVMFVMEIMLVQIVQVFHMEQQN